MMIAAVVGTSVALATVMFAQSMGFERRTFYASMVCVTASYYVLFVVFSGNTVVLGKEIAMASLFVLLAIAGFRRSMIVLAGALVLHAVFDVIHGALIENPGAPVWWPTFCIAFDIAAALGVLRLTRRSRGESLTELAS